VTLRTLDDGDYVLEPAEAGWRISRGGRHRKSFPEKRDDRALMRACEWAWERAEEEGVNAWLVRDGRRERITFDR
jgi:hypothetical protein